MKLNKSKYRVRNKNIKNIFTAFDECKVDIPYDDYVNINKGLMHLIVEKLLKGEKVILPANSGQLEIVGAKVRPIVMDDGKIIGVAPDWTGTKRLWDSNPEAKKKKTLIYHFNEHSNGIKYKIKWHKLNSGMYYRSLYSFYSSRTLRRSVWRNILQGKEYRVDNRINEYEKSKLKSIKKMN